MGDEESVVQNWLDQTEKRCWPPTGNESQEFINLIVTAFVKRMDRIEKLLIQTLPNTLGDSIAEYSKGKQNSWGVLPESSNGLTAAVSSPGQAYETSSTQLDTGMQSLTCTDGNAIAAEDKKQITLLIRIGS